MSDEGDEHDLSNSFSLDDLQAFSSSGLQVNMLAPSSSDAANRTKIAYVKGHIREKIEKPHKHNHVNNVSNNTIDAQRWLKMSRKSRISHTNN